MAKIRFPLEMANGVQVRTIEELKENFDVKKLVGYFLEGKLQTWLKDRYYDEEAERIAVLKTDDIELAKKICEIFGVEYTETEEVNVDKIVSDNEKIAKIKQFTDDEEIISNYSNVAFSQEELADLYDSGVETIYLCEGDFKIPKSKQELKYVIFGGAKTNFVEKKVEEHILDEYSYEIKTNYIFDEKLSRAEISSEGKPYNLKVKGLYKINKRTREEKLVTEERDNVHKFIVATNETVIFTIEDKCDIYMLKTSGDIETICNDRYMKDIEFVYADDEKVLWKAERDAYHYYYIAYYGEKYNVLLNSWDYGNSIIEIIKVYGEWVWVMVGETLYTINLKKRVKRQNYGISWTIRAIVGENNDETEYFRNRFIENVSAIYSYGKEIVVASKNKLYLVDCESLKKEFIADYSYYVNKIVMNNNKITYIDENRNMVGQSYNKLFVLNRNTNEQKKLDEFETSVRSERIELNIVDEFVYYAVHHFIDGYKFRYRIGDNGVKEDASNSKEFNKKTLKEDLDGVSTYFKNGFEE